MLTGLGIWMVWGTLPVSSIGLHHTLQLSLPQC
jgi:hypothetical protein